MDHYSILDRSSSSPAMHGNILGASASVSANASVSAGIAAANALAPKIFEPEPRFPGEDSGHSLSEMAHRDLDAALQLLAERAQYITAASGAAIALRRGEHHDMLCRASAGSNAPELGALLSMEYGLSGECVRTRQPLRCDDAERDPRVNREVCRDLGIASVVVMPIVSDGQVLGVFELLSGAPRAFAERDLSALLRMSEMVETAVKYAVATQLAPTVPGTAVAEIPAAADESAAEVPLPESSTLRTGSVLLPEPSSQEVAPAKEKEQKEEKTAPVPKKPLFWSAAMRAQSGPAKEAAESIAVPPVLRKLQKCQACGFPVSQGRAFCVECEERQWRGQRLPSPAVRSQKDQSPPVVAIPEGPKTPVAEPLVPQPPVQSETAIGNLAISAHASADRELPQDLTSSSTASAHVEEPIAPQTATPSSPDVANDTSGPDSAAPFLSSALQSESWFASNKYILGMLLVVAIVVGAIAWLH